MNTLYSKCTDKQMQYTCTTMRYKIDFTSREPLWNILNYVVLMGELMT